MSVEFDDDKQATASQVKHVESACVADRPALKKPTFKLPKISIPAIRLPAMGGINWRKAALVLVAAIGIGMVVAGAWLSVNKNKPPVVPAAQVQPQVAPEPAKPVQTEPVQAQQAAAPEPVAAPVPTKAEKTPEQLAAERKARLNRQLSGLLHQTK